MRDHRFFAALYDRLMASSERAGLGDMRAGLLAQASGRTLELGAGTGLNLTHYGDQVTELVLTEPDRFMAARLLDHLAEKPPPAPVEVLAAPAERLPAEDGSVDTVVSTLVLCTVEDQRRSLQEVRRVLRRDGLLLFLEHVRSGSPRIARWQDRLNRPWWGLISGGCNCNRDTAAAITGAGLEIERLEPGELPKAPFLAKPLIRGSARPLVE